MTPTENKPELPAEVREAIETAYINWFSNHMPPRLQDHIASALAPLWPKDLLFSQRELPKALVRIKELEALLAPAPSDAEILSGYWKARAEKAEAGAEQYYQNWQSELASNSVRIKQRDDAIAERDQLRAKLVAAQEAMNEVIRRNKLLIHQNTGRWDMRVEHDQRSFNVTESNSRILAEAIAAARAKEDTRHD